MYSPFQLRRQEVLILLLQFTNSLGTSALVPMMSFFIVEGLGAEPWKVGLYTGLVLPLTLVTNRWAGERLDHGFPVKSLLLMSICAYILATVLLTQTSSFFLLLAAVAPLMGVANTGAGIIFTYGRLNAERRNLDIARINSWQRMTVSLGWMIGPALSFTLVAQFGFQTAFICAFGIGLTYLALWNVAVPKGFRSQKARKKNGNDEPVNWGLLIAGLTCLGFIITNSLFVSAMPLFFVRETGLPGSTPGLSLSVKCLVEVFVIFGSVRLAERIGVRQVLLLAACLATASMLLFAQVTAVWQALTISMLEGTYYGLFAGVSISFVQSFAPDRPGRATAIYMNSLFLGGMIGSVSMGFIASATDFRTVLYTAALSSVAALVVLLATLKVRPQPAGAD
ncbi:MFS transporter [Roseibium marinum]|uniref:SET family sugar efflux transporter-like MFS transporter n=1 Tax=Roseibium marinum TaxID=281252 RepID=A0A2S3UYX0_9HYPH|nr:MFS transporter [Roseibium marinum]POF32921.1 SET family sugar efflux transporter-like MFS transporter [Roseibium marinum]